VGENGAGKTTLTRHFNGLLKPETGEVSFYGTPVHRLRPSERAAAVGVCFQNPNDQFFETVVRKEILAGPKRMQKIDWQWFETLSDTLDLHPLLDRSPFRLSEGEKRRVALGAILAMRPQVLVLDEPTAGLDGRLKETLARLCTAVAEMGIATVVVTHDLDFARATADRWIVLHAGRVAGDGDPAQMREKLFSLFGGTAASPCRSAAGRA
jgi:energy-coupling factor transport system ATP-binding protein